MIIQKNVLLKDFSYYKIGGPAKFFVELKSPNDFNEIDFSKFDKIFVLGGGTNVLLPDEGFDGLVIHNSIKGIVQRENELHLGAGEQISDILSFCIEHSLSGLEWAGGLPGTIGGAVRGNAGAFGGETKDAVLQVESCNVQSREYTIRTNRECKFGYRSSVFKHYDDIDHHSEIITKVVLKLEKGDKSSVEQQTREKIDYRNLKHPMDYPNIGSTFKNIPVQDISEEQREEFKSFIKNDPFPVVFVTKLLALAGLKGKKEGGAQISEKHPNFIVNLGNAKASDVLKLIELMKKTVKEKFNIELEPEIQIL